MIKKHFYDIIIICVYIKRHIYSIFVVFIVFYVKMNAYIILFKNCTQSS